MGKSGAAAASVPSRRLLSLVSLEALDVLRSFSSDSVGTSSVLPVFAEDRDIDS